MRLAVEWVAVMTDFHCDFLVIFSSRANSSVAGKCTEGKVRKHSAFSTSDSCALICRLVHSRDVRMMPFSRHHVRAVTHMHVDEPMAKHAAAVVEAVAAWDA